MNELLAMVAWPILFGVVMFLLSHPRTTVAVVAGLFLLTACGHSGRSSSVGAALVLIYGAAFCAVAFAARNVSRPPKVLQTRAKKARR